MKRSWLFTPVSSVLMVMLGEWASPAVAGKSETGSLVFPPVLLTHSDIALPSGLPSIGKWMYRVDGRKANWLGVKWRGKNLIEPINIILIDGVSRSAEEARKRLYDNIKIAGFTNRKLHSSGYAGYISDNFYSQLPSEKFQAFSDGDAARPNNHGRIFGPCYYGGKFVFIAAFSREIVFPTAKIWHRYGSFKKAREAFSRKLDKCSIYKIVGSAELDNAIVKSPENTTGDHDGQAVILSTNN